MVPAGVSGTVGSRVTRDPRDWMVPLGIVTMAGVAAGVLARPQPSGAEGRAVLPLLVLAAGLWAVALLRRIEDGRVLGAALVGTGLAGAAIDWIAGGPAFVLGYMAVAGLALRLPRRAAALLGVPVLAALAVAESHGAADPTGAVLSVALGAGFLFSASAMAAANRDARRQAEALLEQEARTRAAQAEAAALAERTRLARELHDVLAHSLSGLAVQLEGARLLAASTGADPRLAEQVAAAQRLVRGGLADARRAVQALRGEALPGPADLAGVVADASAVLGTPVTLTVHGEPRMLSPEAGLAVYRTVQEALTNVAKHAGPGSRAGVDVAWTPDAVTVTVTDDGNAGSGAEGTADHPARPGPLPSGRFGLAGLAERAAAVGGTLTTQRPDGGGFVVRLRLEAPQ